MFDLRAAFENGLLCVGNQFEPVIETLVLSVTWLYADEIENEVHVIKRNFKPGSGDHEDPPEIKDDQYGEFYGISMGKYPDGRPPYGGMYTIQSEAMEYAVKVCPSLKWSFNVKNTQQAS